VASLDVTKLNTVTPPNIGWENFINAVDEVPSAIQQYDVLITLSSFSNTAIVPDGTSASSYISGFYAPVVSSPHVVVRSDESSPDTINQTIYYPQYIWVDLGPAPASASSISIADAAPVFEGTKGPLVATFTVTLSSASTDTIKVDYATQDGTAKAGTDYTAESGTLTFAPGQTSETISVPVTNHTLASESQAFNVVLNDPVDVEGGSTPTITQATGTATLYNGLFTTGADTVDFNNLTTAQQQAIAAGADTTHGLGGNDNVTLPNSGDATFYTGSTTNDTNYRVAGGGGNYTIFEGAGTETISINGDGNSNITAGSGGDTITINGKQ
jgi:hypothetical protein